MNKLKIVLLAIVVYLGFVIAYIPARFVVNLIALPAQVKLGAVNGTIWSGRVDSVRVGNINLDAVRWQLLPSKLLSLTLGAQLQIGQGDSELSGQGLAMLTSDGLRVEDFELDSSAQYLSTIYPLPAGLGATGDVRLQVSLYQQAHPYCQELSGTLQLTQGKIASDFGQVPVESARVALSCDSGSVVGLLKPTSNSLGIDTKISLSPQGQLSVAGFVEPPDDAPRDFVALLSFSGQPDGRGRYPVSYATQLR